MIIDLRSDTVTKPTQAMRTVMAGAEVGDDVFGEDPSILALEEMICALFGTEAAVFMPTATMSNQIALKIHTRPLDEIICDKSAHIYQYEVGGYAFHSACSIRYIEGERGVFTAEMVQANIQPDDVHKPITRLVCIENTVNRGGGKIFPLDGMHAIRRVCDQSDLRMHLDGSRLFNAMVATGTSPHIYGSLFDTITLCFSKGLGCPAGSILTGKKEHLRDARRVRKVFGGGMRQAGILASACVYALENHIKRLVEDHTHAEELGLYLQEQDYISEILKAETNILIFKLADGVRDSAFIEHLAQHNILAFAIGDNWVRFVTHLDIRPEMIEACKRALGSFR